MSDLKLPTIAKKLAGFSRSKVTYSTPYHLLGLLGIKCDMGRKSTLLPEDNITSTCVYTSDWDTLNGKNSPVCIPMTVCGRIRHVCSRDRPKILGWCCICHGDVSNVNGNISLKSTLIDLVVGSDVPKELLRLEPKLYLCDLCRIDTGVDMESKESEQKTLRGLVKLYDEWRSMNVLSASDRKELMTKASKKKRLLETTYHVTTTNDQVDLLKPVPVTELEKTIDELFSKDLIENPSTELDIIKNQAAYSENYVRLANKRYKQTAPPTPLVQASHKQ